MSQLPDPMHRLQAVRDSIAARAARMFQPEPAPEPLSADAPDESAEATTDELRLNTRTWEAVVEFAPEPHVGAGVINGMTPEGSLNRKTADFLDGYRYPKHK